MTESTLKLIINAQDKASSVLKGVEGALTSVANVAKKVAVGAFVAVGAGMAAVSKVGLGFNNSMEQASLRIQAFTKDSEKTAQILQMVKDRADKTPFAFEEMSNAAASMMPTMRASGKSMEYLLQQAEILAASNPLEGLSGASFALKEAVSGDFTSIIERFNLSRSTINKLKEEGVPNLEIVERAMGELGLSTDLVTGLASSAEGRWSTFKDTLTGFAGELTKPIFDVWKNSLVKMQGFLDANKENISRTIKDITTGIPAIFDLLKTGDFKGGIFGLEEDSPFINALFVAREAVQGVYNIARLLITGDFKGGIFGLSEDSPWINALFVVRDLLIQVGDAIGTAVVDRFNLLVDVVNQLWNALQPLVEQVFQWFIDNKEPIMALFSGIYDTFISISQMLIAIFVPIFNTVISVLMQLWNILSPYLIPAFIQLKAIIDNVVSIIMTLWNWLAPILLPILEKLAVIIGVVVVGAFLVIINVIKWVTDAIKWLVSIIIWLGENFTGVFEGAKRTLFGILDFITGIFTGNWSKAWGGVKDIFGGIFDQISGMAKGVINTIIDSINRVSGGINSLGNSIEGVTGINVSDIPQIPRLAIGTPMVKKSGLAVIHEGEAVVTKAENPNNPENEDKSMGNRNIIINLNFSGQPLVSERDMRNFFSSNANPIIFALKQNGVIK